MYKLLIVDDEPHILKGVEHTLDWVKYGFGEIKTATGYKDAIEKAIEMNPDLGIFDVCIGNDRGYDIIKKLYEYNLKTVYLLLSGYENFEYAREALRCGAKDYLLKPLDREYFKKAVEKIIIEDLNGTIDSNPVLDKDIDPVLLCRYDIFSTLISRLLQIVRAEYAKNINLKILAQKFKMNSTYLGQIFLKETNLKFSEYLMKYRMLKAKERITLTEDKISVIAAEVGYININYFYTHFKNCFGISPTDLR